MVLTPERSLILAELKEYKMMSTMRGGAVMLGAEVKADSKRIGIEWRLVLGIVTSIDTEHPRGEAR